jgi:hypothetical protein
VDGTKESGALPKGYKRLALDQPVRLRHLGIATVASVERDGGGEPVSVSVTLDKSEDAKAPGAIHWCDAATSVPCEVRQYVPRERAERARTIARCRCRCRSCGRRGRECAQPHVCSAARVLSRTCARPHRVLGNRLGGARSAWTGPL